MIDIRKVPRFVSVSDGELLYQVIIVVEQDWEEALLPLESAFNDAGRYFNHVPETNLVCGFAKTKDSVQFQNSNENKEDSSNSICDREIPWCMDDQTLTCVQVVRSEEGYYGNDLNSFSKEKFENEMTEITLTITKMDLRFGKGFGRVTWGFPWNQRGFNGLSKKPLLGVANGVIMMMVTSVILSIQTCGHPPLNLWMKDCVLSHFGPGTERRRSSFSCEMEWRHSSLRWKCR